MREIPEAEKTRYKWIAWIGLPLGIILLLLTINMEYHTYVIDAIGILGFVAIVFGVVSAFALAYAHCSSSKKERLVKIHN
ncbi:MAG: DUF418 domain-containing protein [Thermoproteota archaeon]|nr:DUF418 domain-containing protein [Thermoproteota archaeon]